MCKRRWQATRVSRIAVGHIFQDHYLTFSVYHAKPDTATFDEFARADPKVQKKVFRERNQKGTCPLATKGIDAGVKIRPMPRELGEMKKWPTLSLTVDGSLTSRASLTSLSYTIQSLPGKLNTSDFRE